MIVPDFAGIRVLVVGDVMLDRYWHGDVTRLSQEAPVPVVAVSLVEERAGGAANVALNCAALGAHVTLLSVFGEDEDGAAIIRLAMGAGVRVPSPISDDNGMPTTVKLRVIGQRQQMMRIDFEGTPGPESLARLTTEFKTLVPDCDIVIASDYGKGVLGRVQDLIQIANAFSKPVFVDPKGDDWTKYAGATMVKPNANELQQLRAGPGQKAIGALLVTRGADGMDLLWGGGGRVLYQAAYTRDVADVTGAGDTVMAVVACMRAAGRPWPQAMYLASKAAGIVVGRLGTSSVTRQELIDA